MCRNSVSRRLTASPADMRCEGMLCQHRSIMYHTRSEISWWFGRGGLAPFSIEYVATISVISENGGRPVMICLDSRVSGLDAPGQMARTSQATTPKAYISLAFVGRVGSVGFCDVPGQVNSRAWPRESRLVLVLAAKPAEDAFPRPAIWTTPSLPTKMFA